MIQWFSKPTDFHPPRPPPKKKKNHATASSHFGPYLSRTFLVWLRLKWTYKDTMAVGENWPIDILWAYLSVFTLRTRKQSRHFRTFLPNACNQDKIGWKNKMPCWMIALVKATFDGWMISLIFLRNSGSFDSLLICFIVELSVHVRF